MSGKASKAGIDMDVSRRSFLLRTGGFSVAVAFGTASAPEAANAGAPGTLQPNGWIRVGTDGIVTVYCASAEMGQGVRTAMPLLIAEEMDLDWARVRIEQAPHDPKTFGNPYFNGGMTTGASQTMRGLFDIMRLAGLQAREVLRLNAARHWRVPPAQVHTEPHVLVHGASGRRLGYGEVARFALVPEELPSVTAAQLKTKEQFRLIGKDVPRVDIPDKVAGRALYGIDVELPGMLHGAILRAPVQGEQPLKVDDSGALAMAGVRKVVRLPYGVGVVADSWWTARNTRDALKVEWTSTARARGYSSEPALKDYRDRARNLDDHGITYVRSGDAETAMASGVHRLQAEFSSQHLAHACMEPMNCTARVDGDKLEIWAPTQSPSRAVQVAGTLGFRSDNVRCHTLLMGGGFGRRLEGDYVADAVALAKAMPGVAVKVLWTREDDLQNDKYRPLVAQHLSAAVDASGRLVALRHRLVGDSIFARLAPPVFEKSGGRDLQVNEGAIENTYGVPNHVLYYLREQHGFDVGLWRAIGPGYTKFAVETLMDDLAALTGQDAIDFRVLNLAGQPRGQAVLRKAAAMAGWERPRAAGRALGVAYSDCFGSHAAQVAEVSVDRASGRIRVHEVWCAVDVGLAVQPRNVARQVESALIYGLSAALDEKVVVLNGQPQVSNFHDYPVLRMDEAPVVHVDVLASDERPGGAGEVGLPPIAPAMSNAVRRLTGTRLRDLPFDAAALKT